MSSRVAINNLNLYIDIHVNVFHVCAYEECSHTLGALFMKILTFLDDRI